MSDARQFKLPDVGEGLTEAEIISWRVKPGDTVRVNDIVVEIETAKSLVELPSPYAGTVADLLVGEGETVAVGTPIIAVSSEPRTAGEVGPAPAADEPPAVESPAPEAAVEPGLIGGPAPGGRTSVLVGYGPRTTEAKRRPRRTGAPGTGTSSATAHQSLQTAFSTDADHRSPELPVEDAEPALPQVPADTGMTALRVLAKPPVRKLAKDLGVDLRTVPASGAGGVVTRADVQAHAGGASAASPGVAEAAEQPPAGRVLGGRTRIPVKGVRKHTAQAMVSSAFTAPHVTEWLTLDATRTVRLVRRLAKHRDFRDVKVSPLVVVAKAVCLAVRRTAEVNAHWDEAAQEIVLEHDVNLGIAAATPRGLVVPNIKAADRMTLRELADALAQLIDSARAGRTQPAEMAGGSFTITNVGVFGVDAGTPILNPGEAGILAVGAISKRPWVVGRQVKPRWVLTLALSFDHRVVDGEQGSRFLADVAAIVRDPAEALLH